MKTEENCQAQQIRLGEGMRLIFDQDSLSSSSSSRSSSSKDSSYSSSRSRPSSYRSRRPHHRRQDRYRSRSSSSSSSSSSNSDSSSDSRSRTRSRSHPRCHRASDLSRCRHRRHSPPRRYRARSRSYSPSPDRRRHHSRRHRAYSRSRSRSSHTRFSRRSYRSRSRSSSYSSSKGRFVGRFSQSPRRKSYRDYRSRSRSPERSSVRLSQKEKIDLLNIAKENASRILGVQNLELPASLKIMEQQEKKPELNAEEWVRADPVPLKKPAQDKDVANEDDHVAKTSPTRKPITFSILNTVAKPSSSPTFHMTESKVTSRADSVGNRKPYGHWVPVKKSSPNKHRSSIHL